MVMASEGVLTIKEVNDLLMDTEAGLPFTLPLSLQAEGPDILSAAIYDERLQGLRDAGRWRACRTVARQPESAMGIRLSASDAMDVINFSSNDYLGFSTHPSLIEASIAATRLYGTGSAASRLISGTSPLTVALEHAVADFKQTEAALTFSSGYQANVGILQALLEPGDWLFADRLNHASLVDGCLLSDARWTRYRHLDLTHLRQKLEKAPKDANKWIVTDSVFSMDGDFPDLAALADLAEAFGARILVDEAHATGIYGDTRRSGLCEAQGVSHRIALQMGTFSKALGGMGAYVAGSRTLIDVLVNRARGFIYSTAPAPGVQAAAMAAIQQVQRDRSATERLWQNITFFQAKLEQGASESLLSRLSFPFSSPIIPVLTGDSETTVQASEALLQRGFFVQGIRPPTVPSGQGRLRIALSAVHTETQLSDLASALIQVFP